MAGDPSDYRGLVCSFCGRHNREVRVVANDAGLIVCQVCVARPPRSSTRRWTSMIRRIGQRAGRSSSRRLRRRHVPSPRASASRSIQFDVVTHSDWSTSPQKRWSAEARFTQDHWVAAAPRLVPDPTALITPGESKLLGFDFPVGLPIPYAGKAGIEDSCAFCPSSATAIGGAFICQRPRPMRSGELLSASDHAR